MAVTIKQIESFTAKVKVLRDELELLIEQKQEALDNEEDRDYPKEERVDKLNEQIDCMQNGFDELDEVVNNLAGYADII